MVKLHVFSRPAGFFFRKDYALGAAITRTPDVPEAQALEADYQAFRIGFYNFTDKHKSRCKDLMIVVNDGEDAQPYVRALFRKIFAEQELMARISRLNCKFECPQMDARAGQELARRFAERDV